VLGTDCGAKVIQRDGLVLFGGSSNFGTF